MEKLTVKLGISKLTSTLLVEKGRNVHDSLLGNAGYPSLQAMLPDLAKVCDDLDAANKAMEFHGGKVSSDNKQNCERALRSMLKDIGGYVQGISEGDRTLILSAAFDVTKQRTPLPVPEAPPALNVARTAELGVLKARWKRVHGAVLFYLEMRAEGATEWVRVATTTKANHEMTGLETGKKYSFRVQAVASSGISQYSEEASQIAA